MESRLIVVGDLLDNTRESFFSIILEYCTVETNSKV